MSENSVVVVVYYCNTKLCAWGVSNPGNGCEFRGADSGALGARHDGTEPIRLGRQNLPENLFFPVGYRYPTGDQRDSSG
jgi:hypothetical protein